MKLRLRRTIPPDLAAVDRQPSIIEAEPAAGIVFASIASKPAEWRDWPKDVRLAAPPHLPALLRAIADRANDQADSVESSLGKVRGILDELEDGSDG